MKKNIKIPIGLRLDKDLHKRVVELSKHFRISQNAVIVNAVILYLTTLKKEHLK